MAASGATGNRATAFETGRCPGCDGRCGIGFLRSRVDSDAPSRGAAIPTRALTLGALTVFGIPLAATAAAALAVSLLGLGDWPVPSVFVLASAAVVAFHRR